ncbi:hypothetical protein [Sphaerisporangium album]|uniref:hypothetical protein n=1 Tax=Sphaerisporangium album TaxID=509200 RepID=UPI0011C01FEE|nr:hypothetical protein [Sphaerisporangium album]
MPAWSAWDEASGAARADAGGRGVTWNRLQALRAGTGAPVADAGIDIVVASGARLRGTVSRSR